MFKKIKNIIGVGKLFLFVSIIFSSFMYSQSGNLETTLKLEEVDGVTIPFQNGSPLPSFEKQNRKTLDLSGTWKKERVVVDSDITMSKRDSNGYSNLVNESNGRYLAEFDDSGWSNMSIPGVENIMYEFPKVPEYFSGGVWYRKSFNIDVSDSSKFVKLIFLAVNYVADVWINGKYIGYHEGGYTPFSFNISSALNFGDQNIIAVRVDNINWNSRQDIIPNKSVDWFNYAGIIHDVYLEFSSPVSIIRNDIVPLDTTGNTQSTIVINNTEDISKEIDVMIEVFEASINETNINTENLNDLIGTKALITGSLHKQFTIVGNSAAIWRSSIKIENAKLWFPNNPNLYLMKVTLSENQKVVDEFITQFGVRTVSTEGNKFLLNNRIYFLPGVARHEDHPIYGRSLPKQIIFDDLVKIKNLNVNFLRTAHYPNHPYTYLILDRLGITAMEEVPLWQVDTEEPWLIQNNDRKLHLQMFREMVYKDYNHPSIIFWSTSNECHEETNRLIYNNMIVDDIKSNYYDKRLITQSAAADNPGAADITQAPLDVAGWTMYFGIFYDRGYTGPTFSFINEAKTNFPDKPILDTEFGYWSSENNSTLEKQVEVFDQTFQAFKFQAILNKDGSLNPNGVLMATTWWCAFDWYSSFHPNGFQSMGLFSMDRNTEKPVATSLRSAYLSYFNSNGILTSLVDDSPNENKIISKFGLNQNYPNPFNPTTKIKFSLPEKAKVKLQVYNDIGEKVTELINGTLNSGFHEVEFKNSKLASGIYFYRLKAGKFVEVKKMMLLK